jgi:hypothetical protein
VKADWLVQISKHNKYSHRNIPDHSADLNSWRLDLQSDFSGNIIAK